MGNTHPSDAAADVRSNLTAISNRPSAKDATRRIEEASRLYKAENEAFVSDLLVLRDSAVSFSKELARPTPMLLTAMVSVIKAHTAVIRELRGYVGSLTAALPGMTLAMREARDKAGAYDVEELEAL